MVPKTIRAVVIHEAGRASVERMNLPEVGRDGVLIQVAYAGICATDLEILDGTLGYYKDGVATYPIVPGHEVSGHVVATGEDVTHLHVGDRVVVECIQGCGGCNACRDDLAIGCTQRAELGVIGRNGGYAESFVVAARFVHRLPDSVDLRAGCLCEPLAVALKGLRRLGASWGDSQPRRCAIVGAGPLGRLCAAVLVHRGHTVTLIDSDPRRLEAVPGGIRISDVLSGLDSFDAVVEATGEQVALESVLRCTRRGAAILLLGLPYLETPFSFETIVAHDKIVIGSVGSGAADFAEALAMMPLLDMSAFITEILPLESFQSGWDLARSRSRLKVLLAPGRTDVSGQAPAFWLLGRGIKSMLRCDDAEVIAGIAGYVVAQSRGLSILSAIIERTRGTSFPPAVAVFGAVRSYLQVRSISRSYGAVWIAKLGNERRELEKLPGLVPEIAWTEIPLGRMPQVSALRGWSDGIRSLRRLTRLARVLDGRYAFYKVLRALELTGFYMRYLRILKSGRFVLAAVSNHSNPHGMAFALAAKKCGIPVVLVTHGMPIRPVARLSYDLALVHCEAARRTYEADGCRLAQVLVHGRRDAHAPMPRGPIPDALRVGVFLCKDVREARLRELVTQLLSDARISDVLVRAHPTNFWRGLQNWVSSQNDRRLQLSDGRSVSSDLDASDIVLAGNSSVLIEAAVAGRPAGYVRGLDCGPDDLHGFVAEGLIYQSDDKNPIEAEKMHAFYAREEWGSVLRVFANVDEYETQVAGRFAAGLRELTSVRGNGA